MSLKSIVYLHNFATIYIQFCLDFLVNLTQYKVITCQYINIGGVKGDGATVNFMEKNHFQNLFDILI